MTAIELARSELVAHLRSFDASPIIERYRSQYLSGKLPRELLEKYTVDKTIYRAFPHERPSLRYKRWRWYSRAELLMERLDAIRDQETFDRFAIELGDSLVLDWGATNDLGKPGKMNIGVAMKIVNIAIKHLSFSDPQRNPSLIEFLHVPWDKFTLGPLRTIWREHPAIPTSPGMGFVKNLATYRQLHLLISSIAQDAGVPRIVYEFWKWDAAH